MICSSTSLSLGIQAIILTIVNNTVRNVLAHKAARTLVTILHRYQEIAVLHGKHILRLQLHIVKLLLKRNRSGYMPNNNINNKIIEKCLLQAEFTNNFIRDVNKNNSKWFIFNKTYKNQFKLYFWLLILSVQAILLNSMITELVCHVVKWFR